MAVKFSIIAYGTEEEKESLFIAGHVDEETLEKIDCLWEKVEDTSSLDAVPVKVVHYIYTGDNEGVTRDASEDEMEKLMGDAYNMYREGLVVISDGYELELTGGRIEEIVMGKEKGIY